VASDVCLRLAFAEFRPANAIGSRWFLFSKGWSMKLRYLAMPLTMFMLSVFLGTGCSSSNEEDITGPTPKGAVSAPVKSYGEAVKIMEEEQRAKAAEAKGAKKKR
jgi:hypothetical protein